MFQVQHTILSDDIATFRFACDLDRCKGGCCVIGESGAQLTQNEIPVLNKAWKMLNGEMRHRAQQVVKAEGLIKNSYQAPELNCTDGAECVFVVYDDRKVAGCGIETAWQEGRFDWIKPLSCHLFPVRVMKVKDVHYLNVEYVPSLCRSACEQGVTQGVFLSDFLKDALIRAYGEGWYLEFYQACCEVREKKGVIV